MLTNQVLDQWIQQISLLCKPTRIHLCDGSDAEYEQIAAQLVRQGTLVSLNSVKRPNSYWCHSHVDDVARVEENTFICSTAKEEAGPTNNWKDPVEMREILQQLFAGCMQGRTMYVIPYCMGPLGSEFSIIGVEITDSPYVVLNMKLMTRMGAAALAQLGSEGTFVPGIHSVGVPLAEGEKDVPWPCNPTNRWIAHFPETKEIWSFGSGYGGNALLGKKCLALRIATAMSRDASWLAEHMLILGLTSPQGEKKYIAAAFPSSCGKTNLAMMRPALPGWKIECVGDDIAWLRFGKDGRLYAVNPEAGYFGVAPGTSLKTNPNAMMTIAQNAIFTNVALTEDKDVWWEGIGVPMPPNLTSWLGELYDPTSGKPAAHPNSRFTVSAKQNPMYDPETENPAGVPISAILFGGRRNGVIPLVVESFSWADGVFKGAAISSETTAASKGVVGKLRHDPFAMLPFCGYHMGDYFAHWLAMGEKTAVDRLPKIYAVNWFLKNPDGSNAWPGFGENSRVLKWIFERSEGKGQAKESPIGFLPVDFDLSGLSLDSTVLFNVDREAWLKEADEIEAYFTLFGDKLPRALTEQLHALRARLA